MKINTKIIVYFLGFLLLINGGFMFLTALLSYIYQDGITNSLLMSGVLVTLVGLAMLLLNKNHDKQINKREGYLVVVLGWLAMIFSGTIPYILTGTIDGFSNIFLISLSERPLIDRGLTPILVCVLTFLTISMALSVYLINSDPITPIFLETWMAFLY